MAKDIGLDSILQELGAFGRYNIINYTFLLFPVFLAGMYGSVYIFEAPDIDYRCNITQCEDMNSSSWLTHAIPNDDDKLSKCKKYKYIDNNHTCSIDSFNSSIIENCDHYVYSEEYSAVKDFDLGCQNWKRTLIGTVHNAGLFISLPVTGFISDKYGRKVALSIASLMNGIFGFLRSFSTSYSMMLVFEFLEAGLGAGAYSTSFVLAMELVGPKGRVFGNTLINAVYVMGLITLAGLSWWLQSWRNLLRIIYIPAMFVISYIWILNESIRWLLSKGRNNEALQILKKAAKINKVQLTDEVLTPLYELEKLNKTELESEKPKEDITSEKEEEKTSNFVKVMRSRVMRKRVAVCSFLWITCTFVYYGLSINSVSLGGNKYVNFMLVAFAEIPANIVCLLVLDRFGRKRVLVITYVLSACLCISLSFLPKDLKWLSLILYLSGKFSITVSYSSVYIYVSEVFPTSVRQSLLAVCSSLGRVGSTLAPLTPLLTSYYNNLPAIFFGSLALVASFLVLTLPETINVALPDTIEEAERISRRKNKEDDSHNSTNAVRIGKGTVHNVGPFISLPVTGIIPDKYERKVALPIASLMNEIFDFLRSFSTSYSMMLVFEFLEAGLGADAYSTLIFLAMKLVGLKGRAFGNTLINAVYVMGLITLAGLSWWLQSWRNFLRIIYIPAMFVISYIWILNESIRWLFSKGKNDEALQILKKAAKINKIRLTDESLNPLYAVKKLNKKELGNQKPKKYIAREQEKKKTSNFIRVMRSSVMRKRIAVCSFLWITCTFVYYGLSIN